MSDMNQMPRSRDQGFMGAATDPVRKNMSIMNPIDMAAMKQEGGFSPQMTVIEVLEKIGIDPNGPAQQLVEFGRKQVENADMAGKMQNIAADSEAQPVPPAGLEGLMGARNGN